MHVKFEVVVQYLLVSCTAVALYPVITEPPLEEGAIHETAICALLAIPVTPVGAAGVLTGVTEAEAADERPVPAALIAITVKEYAVPLVSAATVQVKTPVVVQCLLVSCAAVTL